MDFFNYLLNTYGTNEVILSRELSFKEYSLPWIKKMLKKLCDEEKLIRFEKGIYYIPTDTVFGKSRLDPKKVIEKKYINDGSGIIGYFSGITFMNMLGLSNQMPNVIEIYTNNEPSRAREVPVGSQKVLLRKSRALIDSNNVATMSFLELMNFTDAGFYDSEKNKIIEDYIKKNRITKKMITRYAPYFPDKAMRTLVESEAIYYAA